LAAITSQLISAALSTTQLISLQEEHLFELFRWDRFKTTL